MALRFSWELFWGSMFVFHMTLCVWGGEGRVKCKAHSKQGATLAEVFLKHDEQTWHDKHVALASQLPP